MIWKNAQGRKKLKIVIFLSHSEISSVAQEQKTTKVSPSRLAKHKKHFLYRNTQNPEIEKKHVSEIASGKFFKNIISTK